MMLAVAYTGIMLMLGWNGGSPDWRGILAGFPFVGLWFYGSLVLLLAKAHVDVAANDVSIYYTPLPCFVRPAKIAREEISEITLDYLRTPKQGSYWCIGFKLTDGRMVLLPERYDKEPEARERVAAIQEVLSGGVRRDIPLGTIHAPTQRRDWERVRPVLMWGGAFLAAIVWGLAVEISRYKYH